MPAEALEEAVEVELGLAFLVACDVGGNPFGRAGEAGLRHRKGDASQGRC